MSRVETERAALAGGRHKWCQPGDDPVRRFIVKFDDPDQGYAVFDNEPEARAYFERASSAWNCYLLAALPREPSLSADPGHVPIPRNADEAKAMWLVGERWIRDHAPELLRAPAGGGSAGAEAMRAACLKAALGACYGPPSSWPGDYPKGWRHPPAWGPDEKPTPTLAAWHDNGARDAWFAIRALPTDTDPPGSPDADGTEGRR